MKKSKSGKAYEIISDNPKMDTSGMVGKPAPIEMYVYAPRPMNIKDKMEVREMKQAKKPEIDS